MSRLEKRIFQRRKPHVRMTVQGYRSFQREVADTFPILQSEEFLGENPQSKLVVWMKSTASLKHYPP